MLKDKTRTHNIKHEKNIKEFKNYYHNNQGLHFIFFIKKDTCVQWLVKWG